MTSVIFTTITRTVSLPPSTSTFYGGPGSACFPEGKTTSGTITAALTLVILVVAIAYCVGAFYLYRFTQRNPKAINEATGFNIQTYTPLVYTFLVIVNIIEIAIGIWLLAQYGHIGYYPNVGSLIGVRLTLFSACWTMLTTTAMLTFFLHPALSRHVIASLGSQAIWVFLTWCFWVACVATLGRALPLLTLHARCAGIVYCGQLQTLFAFAVIQMVVFCAGLIGMAWLIWQKARPGSVSFSINN